MPVPLIGTGGSFAISVPISARVQVFGRRDGEAIHALMRPATEKRQGTKSREVVELRCSGRYGGLMSAPASMAAATLARRDVCVCRQAGLGACDEDFVRPLEGVNERSVR